MTLSRYNTNEKYWKEYDEKCKEQYEEFLIRQNNAKLFQMMRVRNEPWDTRLERKFSEGRYDNGQELSYGSDTCSGCEGRQNKKEYLKFLFRRRRQKRRRERKADKWAAKRLEAARAKQLRKESKQKPTPHTDSEVAVAQLVE